MSATLLQNGGHTLLRSIEAVGPLRHLPPRARSTHGYGSTTCDAKFQDRVHGVYQQKSSNRILLLAFINGFHAQKVRLLDFWPWMDTIYFSERNLHMPCLKIVPRQTPQHVHSHVAGDISDGLSMTCTAGKKIYETISRELRPYNSFVFPAELCPDSKHALYEFP